MDFIALDIETADAANSRPCSIGIVLVQNEEITKRLYFLINPETDFSPYAVRIHGITEETVEDAPLFPAVWDEIAPYVEQYPIVAHNASYDFGVIKKASAHYNIRLPEISYICTMQLAKEVLQLEHYTLESVCSLLGVKNDSPHNALSDAEACANAFIALSRRAPSNRYSNMEYEGMPAVESDESMFLSLTPFERECLGIMRDILAESGLLDDMVRYKKSKTLDVCSYYRTIKIGTIRKVPYILIRNKYLEFVDSNLPYSEIKDARRYELQSPDDVRDFAAYICTIVQKSLSEWRDYAEMVSEKTIKKHLREYNSNTYSFVNLKTEPLIEDFHRSALKKICDGLIRSIDDIYQFENLPDGAVTTQAIINGYSIMFTSTLLCRVIISNRDGYVLQYPARYHEAFLDCGMAEYAYKTSQQYTVYKMEAQKTTHVHVITFRAVFLCSLDAYTKDFDCCNIFNLQKEGCCDFKRCISKNKSLAMGCGYKYMLRRGIYFMGRNRSIDHNISDVRNKGWLMLNNELPQV